MNNTHCDYLHLWNLYFVLPPQLNLQINSFWFCEITFAWQSNKALLSWIAIIWIKLSEREREIAQGWKKPKTQEERTDENDGKVRRGQSVEEKEWKNKGDRKRAESGRDWQEWQDVTVSSWGGCCFTLQSHSLSVHSVI